MGKKSALVLGIFLSMGLVFSTLGAGMGIPGRVKSVEAATNLGQLVASMEPGTWAELETLGFTWEAIASSGDAGGNIFDYADSATWDPGSQSLFYVGKGYAGRPWKFISYSAETNTWTHRPDPSWFGENERGHGYDNNTIDPILGIFYHQKSYAGEVYAYDIRNDQWSMLPHVPHTYFGHGEALAYHDAFGGLIRAYSGNVHFYDLNTGQWRQMAQGLPMGEYHNIAEYSYAARAMLIGGGNNGQHEIHKINEDGVITRLANAPVTLTSHCSVVTTDPVSGKFLVLSGEGSFHSYDIQTDRWESLNATLPFDFGSSCGGHRVLAAPLSDHGATIFVKGWLGKDGQVFLYKHSESEIPVYEDGDLNLDGLVNSVDIAFCADIIMERISEAGVIQRADLNEDGSVDVLDLQRIINLVVGG